VLAALTARSRTGHGEHVDLAMFDAMLAPGAYGHP
jgi:crotonobetainyl-CoA:carnitine CoA-transferase CaiB-like acyl-CoA transferase